MATILGIDRIEREGLVLPGRGRVGVLCNGTTVSGRWTPSAEAIAAVSGIEVDRVFSPQHGFASEKQDNMVASEDGVHRRLGIPIHSLYGERREPTDEQFDGLDALIIDLQDVGTRVYTFLVTALLSMRVAARRGVQVIVLDRPNPIGGRMEGPILEPALSSFVGIVDTPLRHGLTAGEYCLYGAWRMGLIGESAANKIAESAGRGSDDGGEWLRIVPLQGWKRNLYYDATGLPWVTPSPNMPTLDTAIVYPGQVILEGTNLSEGRGTTRPFELFGAPYLEPEKIASMLAADHSFEDGGPLAGIVLREAAFEPTFQKHARCVVRGFQFHVADRDSYKPIEATLAILRAVHAVHRDAFAWRQPPYEYENDRLPVDLIMGTEEVRTAIDAGRAIPEIASSWATGLADYRERVRPLLLYGE